MSEGGDHNGVEDSMESSLAPFQTMPNDFRTALDDFRANWQQELKGHAQDTTTDIQVSEADNTPEELQEEAEDIITPLVNDEQAEQQALAKNLFQKAVELEQSGKVYDAIPFYRKAVQIEPDIEYKYYELQKLKAAAGQNSVKLTLKLQESSDENLDLPEDDDVLTEDLYEKFQLDLSHNHQGKLIESSRDAGVITTEMHISALPPELLIYILRWVVSSQLDMRSLEHSAAVCKGMYLVARDEELWRSACVKVWGHNVGTLNRSEHDEEKPDINTPIIPRYSSWRQMFIDRERVLFNGCYISKTTYLRMGENSFQDQFYRPVQLVEYYRYLRFLPDGTAIMMTSADDPTQGVTKLRNMHQLRPDILKGHYRLFGSTLSIVLNKQQHHTKYLTSTASGFNRHRRGSSVYDEAAANNTKLFLEFHIMNTSKRKFGQLQWQHYSIVQTRNKQETSSEFDLSPSKYPPLWFSPVRSYHLDADAPLA